MLKPICARELAIERVETPVLLVNHNNVPQTLHRVLAFLALVIWRMSKCDTGGTDENRRSSHSGSRAFHYIDE